MQTFTMTTTSIETNLCAFKSNCQIAKFLSHFFGVKRKTKQPSQKIEKSTSNMSTNNNKQPIDGWDVLHLSKTSFLHWHFALTCDPTWLRASIRAFNCSSISGNLEYCVNFCSVNSNFSCMAAIFSSCSFNCASLCRSSWSSFSFKSCNEVDSRCACK